MLLIRKRHQAGAESEADDARSDAAPDLARTEPPVVQEAPTLEQSVRDLHTAGHSQRSIARDLDLTQRKVKQIIDREAA
jgi:DNA-binding NarL/FixJ family response regulator